MRRDPEFKAYVKVDRSGLLTSTILFRKRQPKKGNWIVLDANICCPSTTTTSTTTTTTTTEEV